MIYSPWLAAATRQFAYSSLHYNLSTYKGESIANLNDQAASDHIIKNLQRENALIATAWYDLTSRLQSNHVVLQRRHDAPKSWLNKQRQLVNGQLRQRDMLYLY